MMGPRLRIPGETLIGTRTGTIPGKAIITSAIAMAQIEEGTNMLDGVLRLGAPGVARHGAKRIGEGVRWDYCPGLVGYYGG